MVVGRFWIAGAAIAYGMVGAGMTFAGCTAAEAREIRKAALREVSGKVARVDAEQRLVAIEIGGEITAFQIDDSTVFFLPGRQATIVDLREGQPVRAIFEPGGDPAMLQWLELVADTSAPLPGSAR